MYYRTTYRLGEGIDRFMRWMMRTKIPAVRVKTRAVRLAHVLATIWVLFLLTYQLPKVIALVGQALSKEETTNEVPETKLVPRKHVSFIPETVTRQYGSRMEQLNQ